MSKRRLKVLRDQHLAQQFRCDRLACTLSKRQCAERSVRAAKIVIDKVGHVIPQAWAHLMPCRNCPVGEQHQIEERVLRPNQPRRVTPGDEAVAASRARSSKNRDNYNKMKFKVG